jgi:hypothetical protein
VKIQGITRKDVIESLYGCFIGLGEVNDSWTELMLEFHCLFDKFLVALGENIIGILLQFLVEDIDFIRLFFGEGNIADIFEHGYLFAFGQEYVLEVDEELL